MKLRYSLFVLLFTGAIAFFGCSKDDDNDDSDSNTPAASVVQAFDTKYPGASQIKWSLSGNYVKAEFLFNGGESEAWFSNTGTWIVGEHDMTYTALPTAVKDGFAASQYASWTIDNVCLLQRANLADQYLIEVEYGGSEMTLFFALNGTLKRALPGDYDLSGTVTLSQTLRDFITQKYPNATLVDVVLTVSGNTLIYILDDNYIKEVTILSTGSWSKTQWSVAESQVPQVVLNALKNSATIQGFTIDDIYYQVFSNGNEYYHFELDPISEHEMGISVNIDSNGKFV